MFPLAVSADTTFLDRPFLERCREIARAGFGVDFWLWTGREADLEAVAADPGVRVSSFSGYLGGSLVHPDGLQTFLDGVQKTLPVARKLRCRDLVLSTGEINNKGQVVHPIAAHPVTRWVTAYRGLCQLAEWAEKHDVVYSLENLNTKVDHPGYPLPRVEDAVSRGRTGRQPAGAGPPGRVPRPNRGGERLAD